MTEERKVGGTKKKKKKKTPAAAAAATTSTSTTWGKRWGPERGESPVISQTPPLPKDTSSDKKVPIEITITSSVVYLCGLKPHL